MWQIKYTSAIPKNLGVVVDFQPCSEGDFTPLHLRSINGTVRALGQKRVKSFYNRRAGNYNFQTILSVKITNVVWLLLMLIFIVTNYFNQAEDTISRN